MFKKLFPGRLPFFGLSFSLFFVYAVIATFPLLFNLERIPGEAPGDVFEYAWNAYNFWRQIADFANPLYTKIVLYPLGSSLVFHAYGPLMSIFALPFLNNLIVYLNLVLISSLTLAAFSAELLGFLLTKNKIASFLAGAVYGFSPIILSFYQSQHYQFALAAVFLPLGIYCFLRFFQSFKNYWFYLTALIFIACFLTEYYTTILLSICLVSITLANLLIDLYHRRFLSVFNRFFPSAAKGMIAILLFILTVFSIGGWRLNHFLPWLGNKGQGLTAFCNTNLAGFFIPSSNNPLLGSTSAIFYRLSATETSNDTPSYFLGWWIPAFTLLVSLVLWRRRETLIAWLIMIIVFSLSLGPAVRLGPNTLLINQQTPYWWFAKLPFLGLIDCSVRFPIAIQIGLSMLTAMTIARLTKNFTLLPKFVFLLFFLVVFYLEYGYLHLDLNRFVVPKVYQKLTSINDQRTILELPSGLTESKSAFGYDYSIAGLHELQMYWQTIHHKPRVGAYLSRISPQTYSFFRNTPVIADLFTMTSLNGQLSARDYSSTEIADFIKKFNLGFIILSPNNRQNDFSAVIDRWFAGYIKDKSSIDGFVFYQLK